MPGPIRIVPFAVGHGDDVVALILTIQQAEFGIPITLQAQPDLLDIAGFYRRGDGNFWVALDGARVVGTAALLDIGQRQAALRKMFVAASHRGGGRGVAPSLLAALLAWARQRAVSELFLGTTAQFVAAHRFYEKHGFREVALPDLPPTFPVMSVDTNFYMLALAPDTAQVSP